MTWKAMMFVFLGGGVGSLIRYALSLALASFSEKFPFATLIANIISCVLLGYLIGMSSKTLISDEMKLFFMVGICGGFSTFSTFSAESFQLFNSGNSLLGILYMAASFLICLLAIYLGIKISG